MPTTDPTAYDLDFSTFTAIAYQQAPEIVLTQAALHRYRTGHKPAALTEREVYHPHMRVSCDADASAALTTESTHPRYPTDLHWPRVPRTLTATFEAHLATAPDTPFTRFARAASSSDRAMCAYAWHHSLPLVGPDDQELDPTQATL